MAQSLQSSPSICGWPRHNWTGGLCNLVLGWLSPEDSLLSSWSKDKPVPRRVSVYSLLGPAGSSDLPLSSYSCEGGVWQPDPYVGRSPSEWLMARGWWRITWRIGGLPGDLEGDGLHPISDVVGLHVSIVMAGRTTKKSSWKIDSRVPCSFLSGPYRRLVRRGVIVYAHYVAKKRGSSESH